MRRYERVFFGCWPVKKVEGSAAHAPRGARAQWAALNEGGQVALPQLAPIIAGATETRAAPIPPMRILHVTVGARHRLSGDQSESRRPISHPVSPGKVVPARAARLEAPLVSLPLNGRFQMGLRCAASRTRTAICQSARKKGGRALFIGARLTLGMVSLLHTPSESRRSRISHANIDGHSRLYSAILVTTHDVATRGLEPPIARGFIDPVS